MPGEVVFGLFHHGSYEAEFLGNGVGFVDLCGGLFRSTGHSMFCFEYRFDFYYGGFAVCDESN